MSCYLFNLVRALVLMVHMNSWLGAVLMVHMSSWLGAVLMVLISHGRALEGALESVRFALLMDSESIYQ